MTPEHDRWPLSYELGAAAQGWQLLLQGHRWDAALQLPQCPAKSRAAIQDTLFWSARHKMEIERLQSWLNQRPPAPAVRALQAVSLAQLWRLLGASTTPAQADLGFAATIVHQAVQAAKHGSPASPADGVLSAASGFLNATLRKVLREHRDLANRLKQQAAHQPELRWNLPKWWVDLLQQDHPGQAHSLLEAINTPAPLCLRINPRTITRDQFVHALKDAGLHHEIASLPQDAPQAVVLARSLDVTRLPGYREGWFSVQDRAAQWAAPLLGPRPGERVLDACAAPGGKTGHLLELAPIHLTALDSDARRLDQVRSNLDRLNLNHPNPVQLRHADARLPTTWWDGRPFDRILIDAPCSASGIVRRHPDIRWLRQVGDLQALAELQYELLAALWPLLRPGGTLLFMTCSVFAREGSQVIDRLLSATASAEVQPMHIPGVDLSARHPVLATHEHDGFYFCLLQRAA
jgi:16S rRNA (cytosine967-C5)-methyltransferase